MKIFSREKFSQWRISNAENTPWKNPNYKIPPDNSSGTSLRIKLSHQRESKTKKISFRNPGKFFPYKISPGRFIPQKILPVKIPLAEMRILSCGKY